MDLIAFEIPHSFTSRLTRLTWREVAFGIDHDMVAGDLPKELAGESLSAVETSVPLLALAFASAETDVRGLVQALAESEPDQPGEDVRRKWLWLVLSWVFADGQTFDDPLLQVEMIHADFDYPDEMSAFVRYMPAPPEWLDLGTKELNEARLIDMWREYVESRAPLYGRA